MSEPTAPDEPETVSTPPDEVTVNDNGDPTIEDEPDDTEDDGDETETA